MFWSARYRMTGVSFVLVAALSGCQHTLRSVSLEQAKQITAEFVGEEIQVPPRAIDDLLALIDSYKSGRPVPELEGVKKRAASQPDASTQSDPKKLANFYHKRSLAATELGLGDQALSDSRKAVELAEAHLPRNHGYAVILNEAVWPEINSGSLRRAIELAEESQKYYRWKFVNYSQLGRIYVWSGQLDKAREMLSRVRRGEQNPRTDHHTPRLRGLIAQAEGDWETAEKSFRQSLAAMNRRSSEWWVETSKESTKWRIANTLIHQGRISEAELLMREVLAGNLERLGSSANMHSAVLVYRLAQIFMAAGRFEETRVLSEKAIELARLGGLPEISWMLSAAKFRGAAAKLALRDVSGAAEESIAAAQFIKEHAPLQFEHWFADNPNRLLAVILHDPAQVEIGVLDGLIAYNLGAVGPKHYNTAEARALKAAYLSRTGDRAGAIALYKPAFEILLTRSRQSGGGDESDAMRRVRQVYFLENYLDTLAEEIARGAGDVRAMTQEAYRIASEARGTKVTAALAASAARAQVGDPDLAELARREQDAQRRIKALYGLLANAAEQDAGREAILSLRANISDLRASRAALMQEIEARYPDYAQLINPKVPTAAMVGQNLNAGEALLAFYFTDAKGLAFLVRPDGSLQMVEVPVTRRQLSARVARLRRALDPDVETLGEIPDLDFAAAYGLYKDLVAPFEGALGDVRNLFLVAHGDLSQIPLGVLTTAPFTLGRDRSVLFERYREAPWLARRLAISVLPSDAALIALRAAPAPSGLRRELVAFGDPYFNVAQAAASIQVADASGAVATRGLLRSRGLFLRRRATPAVAGLDSAAIEVLPRLPDTYDEVRAIATALGANLATDVFVGAKASERTVKTMNLSDRRVIVFATHGLVAGDLDGLNQPALALSAPSVTGDSGDGLLTMSEILGLRLNADWVVLSACNTASGDGAGAEAISGLGRAFFYAGTKSLLVTSWPVETTSARLLTTTLFERQKRENIASGASALQRANLYLIDAAGYLDPDGQMLFSYAHPIFWAPFQVIGDGG